MQSIMSKFNKGLKTIKNKSIQLGVGSVSCVASATHFLGHTVADVAGHFEAVVKERAYGVPKEDTKIERLKKTIVYQDDVVRVSLSTVRALRNAFKREEGSVEGSFVDKTTLQMVPAEHYKMRPAAPVKIKTA